MSLRRTLVCTALCVCGVAAAQEPGRGVIEQKEALVRRLLGDEPMAGRLAGSAEALREMQLARDLHERSLEHLRRGELNDADARLNEAMALIGRARRTAPDEAQRGAELRARYAQLLGSVEGLRDSYARHMRRLPGASAGGQGRDNVLDSVTERLMEAQGHADAQRLAQALEALGRAEVALLHGLERMLGSATLSYGLQFDSAAQEYGYELERNRSYSQLLPAALAELRPSAQARELIDRYLQSNEALLGLAARQAAERDWHAALGNVKTGTTYLQRALGAAGLVVPQAIKE